MSADHVHRAWQDDETGELVCVGCGTAKAADAPHMVTWSEVGWGCTCGAGRRVARMPVVRARVSAQRHQRAHTP